ncbi:MAG: homoserine dehydrogenase [Clostridia bacterium]|nr:homoserine dehydrogenase [Clostridia bacterium]
MFNIAILGCGVVGSGVADILFDKQEELSKRFNQEVKLSKILDIKNMDGTPYAPYLVTEPADVFEDDSIKLVVVTIGGLDLAADRCFAALKAGKHVVTSNKAVVAAYGRELTKLAYENNVRFLYEASVGGGIPIIRPMNICLSANDIYEIQGILNGTTNYMLTGMYKDKMSFDDILKDAQAKGYAEADPTADVDGFDAARKIAILSSIAYNGFVDFEDVKCIGIRDVIYADHELAATGGYAIKLIAGSKNTEKGVRISVEPKLVDKSRMLAAVNSVYNAILVRGSYTGDSLFYGQGAGKLATASAILGDIIEILEAPDRQNLPAFVDNTAVIIKDSDDKERFYVRLKSTFNDTESEELKSDITNIFGNKAVYLGYALSDNTTAAFISDYCSEAELKVLCDKLAQCDGVESIAYTMRVAE